MRAKLPFATLAIAVLFPFMVTSPYYVQLVATIAIFAIVALGLDVVFGYTGEVSLGHSALFGIGAHTSGALAFQLGIGFLPFIPFAICVAAAFGAVLALPALRVTGPYLAMVTLAFGTIVGILINEMTFLTNGPLGISLHVQNYCVDIVAMLITLVVVTGIVALGPRVRGPAGQPVAKQIETKTVNPIFTRA